MAGLPKSKLVVPLGTGIQTDIDDKLLPAGKVIVLENGVWQRSGELLKRPGSYSLGTQYAAATPGTMPPPWQFATHKGTLMSVSKAGTRPLGAYSPAVNKWIAPAGSTATDNINGVVSKLRGQVLPRRGTVYRSNASGATTSIYAPDEATDGTYMLVVWVDLVTGSSAIVRGQIIEIATGKTLASYQRFASGATASARAVFVNGELRLVFIDGVNVKYVSWIVSNITAGTFLQSGEFSLATDATATALDVIAKSTDMMVLYNGATTRIIRRDSGGVNTASNLTMAGGGAVATGQHAWMSDLLTSGLLAACCSSGADGVRVHWGINAATGVPTNSYTIDAAGGQAASIVGTTISNNATGEFVVLWHMNVATLPLRWGRRQGGVITGPTDWILSASLASKPFLHVDANGSTLSFYVLVAYESSTQGTYFAIRVPTNVSDGVDGNRTPSARYCSGAAPNQPSATPPSVTQLVSADQFMTAQAVRTRLVNSGFFDTGVDTVTFTFNPTNVNTPREFADNLYVCGGMLGAFDGMTFAEEGFHLFPEGLSVVQQLAGSLALNGGYTYVATYRYADENGRLRRSAPSPAISVSLSGSNRGAQVIVPSLKFHGRPAILSSPDKVVIELWRNTNGQADQLFLAAVAVNTPATDTVTITDTGSDATVGANEALYTTGGVLEFQPPPPALAVWSYKDRLALIAADDPTAVWVSFPLPSTEGPRFHENSSFRVDDGRGDLTGGAAVDDRTILFKADTVYTVNGDGIDVNDNGAGFGVAQIVETGIGCTEPRSIVQVPGGVMFRSSATRSGIYVVNRGLAVEYIGAPVQAFLTSSVTVVDAVHLPGLLRTEFFLSSGVRLVYDHVTKLWSTYTNQTCYAATDWKHPSGAEARAVMSQSPSTMIIAAEDYSAATFDDTSSPVEEYVETPWLSLADIKGYFRFDRIQLIGAKRDSPSNHGYIVQVSLFKDNADSAFYTAARTMLVTDDINAVEVRYSAKASTLKVGVRIKMNPADGSNFAGPKLTGIAIWYGTKTGLRKTSDANSLT